MSGAKPKIIAIVGPTASGKTSLSIDIAKKFNGEVISADSRQVYTGMDIGTGKVSKEEMAGIPHHLLDIRNPDEIYTAAEFKEDAKAAISDIRSRNQIPIIAGGTFFYLDQLRGKINSAPVEPNSEFRKTLENLTNEELFSKLQVKDPERAETIDKHNRRRLERALEIVDSIGKVPAPAKSEYMPYKWLIIGVDVDKETLRNNFAKRLEGWLEAGFQGEVERLLQDRSISSTRFNEFGFEYTLMCDYLSKEISLDELKERFVQKNWQYAKRQLTWLKRDSEVEWFSPENREVILGRVEKFLQQ